jgi:hypothetical protein
MESGITALVLSGEWFVEKTSPEEIVGNVRQKRQLAWWFVLNAVLSRPRIIGTTRVITFDVSRNMITGRKVIELIGCWLPSGSQTCVGTHRCRKTIE